MTIQALNKIQGDPRNPKYEPEKNCEIGANIKKIQKSHTSTFVCDQIPTVSWSVLPDFHKIFAQISPSAEKVKH